MRAQGDYCTFQRPIQDLFVFCQLNSINKMANNCQNWWNSRQLLSSAVISLVPTLNAPGHEAMQLYTCIHCVKLVGSGNETVYIE